MTKVDVAIICSLHILLWDLGFLVSVFGFLFFWGVRGRGGVGGGMGARGDGCWFVLGFEYLGWSQNLMGLK